MRYNVHVVGVPHPIPVDSDHTKDIVIKIIAKEPDPKDGIFSFASTDGHDYHVAPRFVVGVSTA